MSADFHLTLRVVCAFWEPAVGCGGGGGFFVVRSGDEPRRAKARFVKPTGRRREWDIHAAETKSGT